MGASLAPAVGAGLSLLCGNCDPALTSGVGLLIFGLVALVCCLGLCLAFICGCGCGWALRSFVADPHVAAPLALATGSGLRAAAPGLRRLAGYRVE